MSSNVDVSDVESKLKAEEDVEVVEMEEEEKGGSVARVVPLSALPRRTARRRRSLKKGGLGLASSSLFPKPAAGLDIDGLPVSSYGSLFRSAVTSRRDDRALSSVTDKTEEAEAAEVEDSTTTSFVIPGRSDTTTVGNDKTSRFGNFKKKAGMSGPGGASLSLALSFDASALPGSISSPVTPTLASVPRFRRRSSTTSSLPVSPRVC
jgi:hypothetical protein